MRLGIQRGYMCRGASLREKPPPPRPYGGPWGGGARRFTTPGPPTGANVDPEMVPKKVPRGTFFGRKVDGRLPGKWDSNSHGARPVHLIIRVIKWIRTSRLSIKNSLSLCRLNPGNP